MSVPLILQRSSDLQHSEFTFYIGNILQCIAPSTGILLTGSQSSKAVGATINIESSNIVWSEACFMKTDSQFDIIWMHPICSASNSDNTNLCVMYLGGGNNNNNTSYLLTNQELNNLNTSSLATLYLGDRDGHSTKMNIIYMNCLQFNSNASIAKNLNIL